MMEMEAQEAESEGHKIRMTQYLVNVQEQGSGASYSVYYLQ